MLRAAYNEGFRAALYELPLAMEKEAELPKFLKNLLLTGAISGGAVGGAGKLGRYGMTHMSKEPQRELISVLSRKATEGPLVDTREFLRRHAPKVEKATPHDMAVQRIELLKSRGEIPRDYDTQEIAQDWLATSPLYQGFDEATNASFVPGLGVVAGRQANPTVLAHEIGHSNQPGLNPENSNSFLSTLLGTQKNLEADAWGRARKNFKIDPEIEDASMAYYQNRHAGAVGGAVAGAGVGGGMAALSLLGLAELAARLKRRR